MLAPTNNVHDTPELNDDLINRFLCDDVISVFLLNRARREDFSVESQCRMQATIAAIFNKSNLKYRGNHHHGTNYTCPTQRFR